MKHISFFTGIGGFDLAAEKLGWENVAHCEIDEFNRTVLKYYWPKSKSYEDITTTDFSIYRDRIDIITGGFPCQDASIAKQWGEGQKGLEGERTGLFFEYCRAIEQIRPKYIVSENVANILKTNKGQDFGRMLSELAKMGYNAEWRICYASELGAPHKRARMYLVAYPSVYRLQAGQTFFSYVSETTTPVSWEFNRTAISCLRGGKWTTEPPVLLLDDGFSKKMDGITFPKWRRESLARYGNSVIPEIPYRIFKAIEEFESLNKKKHHVKHYP